MTFINHPTDLYLAIPDAVQTESWQQGQLFSMPSLQRRIYLNQVCLDTILPWLKTEYVPQARSGHSAIELPGIWSLVDGVAIELGQKRLVLLPTQTLDTSEFRIPKEWVDIPSLAADYFIAVQVNPDEPSLRLWGYTTHEQVKQLGTVDTDDRTYSVDADDLIVDLGLLWVTQKRYPNAVTQAVIAPLTSVPAVQAENLLQRLSHPDLLMPRLEIPFELWAALFTQPRWRQRLEESRINSRAITRTVNLSQWWQSIVDPAWQSIESLLSTNPQLAFNLRETPASNTSLLRRAKPIQVTSMTEDAIVDQQVMLVITLEAESDGRMGIQIQLYGIMGDLPMNLELTLRSSTDTVIQSVQTREQDDCIQLRRFRCAVGTQFLIQIEFTDFCYQEPFVC